MKKINNLQKLSDLLSEARNKYTNDFELIHDLLIEFDIEYCFIGGCALAVYNVFRATENIDILVNKKNKDKLMTLPIEDLTGIGKRFKVHGMKQSYMEVIYSGELLNPGAMEFPEPSDINVKKDGVWVISLPHLISTKLQAGLYGKGRELDIYDVRKLILNNSLPLDYMNKFREDLAVKYRSIWSELYSED